MSEQVIYVQTGNKYWECLYCADSGSVNVLLVWQKYTVISGAHLTLKFGPLMCCVPAALECGSKTRV